MKCGARVRWPSLCQVTNGNALWRSSPALDSGKPGSWFHNHCRSHVHKNDSCLPAFVQVWSVALLPSETNVGDLTSTFFSFILSIDQMAVSFKSNLLLLPMQHAGRRRPFWGGASGATAKGGAALPSQNSKEDRDRHCFTPSWCSREF